MINLPPFTADLIEELNKDFPEACPSQFDSEREIWMKAGERRLVRMLNSKLKALDDNLLEN